MSTHTKVMSKEQMLALKNSLKDAKICKTPPYALYQIKTSECTITAYESGKVVFQGAGADFYADEIKTKQENKQVFPQCGSDEVGTGDYFGPVIVCAVCVKKEDLNVLEKLKIQDSKQINDDDIIKIAPILKQQLTYSLLVLENEKYNFVHATNNMNAIKAKLHNQAFVHLQKKLDIPMDYIIIDQFTPKPSYYRYIKEEKQIIENIHFETKAENKYLSVACASIIARYTFIEAINQLSQRYDFDFPKGAGAKVDEAGAKFVRKYGKDALSKVAKIHFKNTEKIEQLI